MHVVVGVIVIRGGEDYVKVVSTSDWYCKDPRSRAIGVTNISEHLVKHHSLPCGRVRQVLGHFGKESNRLLFSWKKEHTLFDIEE